MSSRKVKMVKVYPPPGARSGTSTKLFTVVILLIFYLHMFSFIITLLLSI
jgi:hypothetical protein